MPTIGSKGVIYAQGVVITGGNLLWDPEDPIDPH